MGRWMLPTGRSPILLHCSLQGYRDPWEIWLWKWRPGFRPQNSRAQGKDLYYGKDCPLLSLPLKASCLP